MIVRNVLVKQAIFHETVNEPTQDDAKYQSFRSFCIPIVLPPFPPKCIEIPRFLFVIFSTHLYIRYDKIFVLERAMEKCLDSEMQVWDSLERVQCLSKFLKTPRILIFSLPLRCTIIYNFYER